MHIRKKILMGLGALVLPLGTVALVGATSGTAWAPALPVYVLTCSGFSANVTFNGGGLDEAGILVQSPPLSPTSPALKTGSTGIDLLGGSDSAHGALGACTDTDGHSNAVGNTVSLNKTTITSNNSKCTGTATPAPSCVKVPHVKSYDYGSWATFTSSGGTSLGKAHLDLTVNPNLGLGTAELQAVSAGQLAGAPCATLPVNEVGFKLIGNVHSGRYKLTGKKASMVACLGSDTGTNLIEFGKPDTATAVGSSTISFNPTYESMAPHPLYPLFPSSGTATVSGEGIDAGSCVGSAVIPYKSCTADLSFSGVTTSGGITTGLTGVTVTNGATGTIGITNSVVNTAGTQGLFGKDFGQNGPTVLTAQIDPTAGTATL